MREKYDHYIEPMQGVKYGVLDGIDYSNTETVEILSQVDKKKVKFVYGDEDSSYRYTPLLRRLYADVVTIKNCDHNFTGRTSALFGLRILCKKIGEEE